MGTAARKHDFTDIMCIRRRWRDQGEGGCGTVNGQDEAAPQQGQPKGQANQRKYRDDWTTGRLGDPDPDRATCTHKRSAWPQSKAGPIADGGRQNATLESGDELGGQIGREGRCCRAEKATFPASSSLSSPCGQRRPWQKWTDAAC